MFFPHNLANDNQRSPIGKVFHLSPKRMKISSYQHCFFPYLGVQNSSPNTNSTSTNASRKRARDSSPALVSVATIPNPTAITTSQCSEVIDNKRDNDSSNLYSPCSSLDEYSTLTNSHEDLMQLASDEEDVNHVVHPHLIGGVQNRHQVIVPLKPYQQPFIPLPCTVPVNIRMEHTAPSNFNRFLLPSVVSRCNTISLPVTTPDLQSPSFYSSNIASSATGSKQRDGWGWFIDAE